MKKTHGVKLTISQSFKEFRCPKCNALLLKGNNLEKAQIEVKCRRCGEIVRNFSIDFSETVV